MIQAVKLVQGFRGELTYALNFNNMEVDISDATSVMFNFADVAGEKRQSIRCSQGSTPYEVVIPFRNDEASEYGRFLGEFVVKTGNNIDVYPVEDMIRVWIRKRI